MAEHALDETESFDEIYEAVMATPRGRRFLYEFAMRNRSADTEHIVRELQRIERTTRDARVDVLRHELQSLAAMIAETHLQIADIRPLLVAGGADRIPASTGELDSIITATERATTEILSAAEHVQDIARRLRAAEGDANLSGALEAEANNILLACSFQDLTGQRTLKVVNTLRYLEQRLGALMANWGAAPQQRSLGVPAQAAVPPPASAINQAEIDSLFA